MKKIEAIIKSGKLFELKEALNDAGIRKLTVSEVKEFDCEVSHTELYRGCEYTIDFMPQLKIEMVVTDQQLAPALDAISALGSAGNSGEGEILVFAIEQALGGSPRKLNRHSARFSIQS